jgi:tRNA threonylcarbamoyladenosine biosynthesis protein TsaB
VTVLILGLDSSTLTASVALLDGETLLFAEDAAAGRHSEVLLPLVDRALAASGKRPADLGAIACGAGPGSFTGLRIGLATAKGLCLALGLPLHLPSSLAALAFAARGLGRPALAVLDARRHEVFAGLFAADGTPLGEESVGPPEILATLAGDHAPLVVGDGVLSYPDAAARAGEPRPDLRLTPSGEAVARLAASTPPSPLAAAAPTYLRGADAIARPPRPPGSRRR